MKREYLTKREIEIARRFKDGESIERLAVEYCIREHWSIRDMEIQRTIRRAMNTPRWWVPKPRANRRRSKR